MDGIMDHQFTKCSPGQQQRVLIALSLLRDPQLLILDEPTAGVDISAKQRFYSLLTHLNARGIAIVLITHEVNVLPPIIKHVLCINNRICCQGPLNELPDMLREVYGEYVIHHHNPPPTAARQPDTPRLPVTARLSNTARQPDTDATRPPDTDAVAKVAKAPHPPATARLSNTARQPDTDATAKAPRPPDTDTTAKAPRTLVPSPDIPRAPDTIDSGAINTGNGAPNANSGARNTGNGAPNADKHRWHAGFPTVFHLSVCAPCPDWRRADCHKLRPAGAVFGPAAPGATQRRLRRHRPHRRRHRHSDRHKPIARTFAVVLLGSVMVHWILKRNVFGDASVSLLISIGVGSSVIIIGTARGFNANLYSYLIGSIFTLARIDLLSISIALTLTVG